MKRARARTVAMTSRVYEDLKGRCLDSKQELETLIFGVSMTIRTAFAKAYKVANVQDFHLHDCRHKAIACLIRARLQPVEVMRVSGHTTLSAFYRYANLEAGSIFRAELPRWMHITKLLKSRKQPCRN